MSKYTSIDLSQVVYKYDVEKKSLAIVAKELNTNAVKLFRMLKKAGHPLRTKSECQKNALATGVKVHPTQGRVRTDEEKINIGSGRSKAWQRDGTTEHSLRNKKIWLKKSARDKQTFNKKGRKAILEASRTGSKLELALHDGLIANDYIAGIHIQALISNEKMHLDLYVKSLKTAIEIDGPSHFLPIHGREKLLKNQERDRTKTALLITSGYNLIRIKNLCKSMSPTRQRETLRKLLVILEQIKQDSKPQLYEMEVI